MPPGYLAVPDWFSAENQGAGIAVTDVTGDGTQDLVVFLVDNPVGPNRGLYRVGRSLDAGGNVTGGWTGWIDVPDWFSVENQGGGIAVADVTGDGSKDLVVFTVDNPGGQNRGVYRVGRNLDANGTVTGGWTAWTDVPDWFSWENQGGGVAVVDRGGQRDLVVFAVDNPVGQNQAFYRVGSAVDGNGVPTGGWSGWFGVPNWFSWENAGASIASTIVGGRHNLAAVLADNPVGQNAGYYTLLPLDEDPATQGKWELLPYHSGVLAIHAAVLPSGTVMFFAGSGNNQHRVASPDYGDVAQGIYTSVVWDPRAPAAGGANFTHPATIDGPDGKPFDFFCGGDTFLADGTLLSAGGNLSYPAGGHGNLGRTDAVGFDPQTQQWQHRGAMAHGRWYPSLLPLADGRVLAVSGLNDTDGTLNPTFEVYSPATDSWQELPVPQGGLFFGLPLYAHMFLLRNGLVFFSGGRMDDARPQGPVVIDLTTHPVTITGVAGLEDPASRNQSASVLLPPAQDQRVMIIGGGPEDASNATGSTAVVDLTAPQPAFAPGVPMSLPRMHLNAVLLPDHTVFVSGGALAREERVVARLQSEIYDPATDTWRIGAAASVVRLYHSIALLLPDGRVITAGGNPPPYGQQVAWEPPDPNEELRLEVYSPPYLFAGPRPIINAAPAEWAYGQNVVIGTPQAGEIKWASIIRPGVTTHSFDNSQRLVDLTIQAQANGQLHVATPDQPTLAPPGWYMLFIVDHGGVPSIASWIHLTP